MSNTKTKRLTQFEASDLFTIIQNDPLDVHRAHLLVKRGLAYYKDGEVFASDEGRQAFDKFMKIPSGSEYSVARTQNRFMRIPGGACFKCGKTPGLGAPGRQWSCSACIAAASSGSVARTQKRWQIKGVRADGGKLAFGVSAYDYDEARKIAEKYAKDKGSTVTDIEPLEERKARGR